MTSPGVVYVDETVDMYRKIRLPKNWTIHYEPEWGSLQASMSWCFEQYPDASHYGWLADDTFPRTPGWDKLLEMSAGPWGLSYARDMWMSEGPIERWEFETGKNLSSGLCWGGELVRTVGWWAIPGVRQAGIDTAWCSIIEPLGLARYRHDIVVEHHNYRTGKRERDEGDSWDRGGDNYVERDIATVRKWMATGGYYQALVDISRAGPLEITDYGYRRAKYLLTDAYLTEAYKFGGPSARLEKLKAEYERVIDDRFVADRICAYANAESPRHAGRNYRVGVGADLP